MTDRPDVCAHGSLARVCLTCELTADLAAANARIAVLEAALRAVVEWNECRCMARDWPTWHAAHPGVYSVGDLIDRVVLPALKP